MHGDRPGCRGVLYPGRVKRPTQRIVIIVLALLLMIPVGVIGIGQLGGDSSQEAQTEDPRPTVNPSEQKPRPEVAMPEAPAVMQEQSAEGAEATLTYMLGSYTYMMTTGDTSVWEGSVDQNCAVCTSFLENAQLLSDQGGYLVGGEFTVDGTAFEGTGEPPATGTVTAQFAQAESTLVDDPTRLAYDLDSVSGELAADMAWDGETWRVTDMSLVPDESAASDAGGAATSDGGAG